MPNYVGRAQKQLNPAYTTQIKALKGQIPAIQQLYQALFQGLDAQGARETQNIFEGTSERNLLYSTIPVDMQTQLQESLLQQRGQLGAKMAQEIGGINERLGGVYVNRANAVSQLGQALQQSALQRRSQQLQTKQSQQQLALQKKLADRQYQLQKQSLRY